jgi:hypothetical protein
MLVYNLKHKSHLYEGQHQGIINVYREIGKFLSFVYFLVEWYARAVSLHPGNVIFAQLAFLVNDVIFWLHLE